jgi:hypothetical protein
MHTSNFEAADDSAGMDRISAPGQPIASKKSGRPPRHRRPDFEGRLDRREGSVRYRTVMARYDEFEM